LQIIHLYPPLQFFAKSENSNGIQAVRMDILIFYLQD